MIIVRYEDRDYLTVPEQYSPIWVHAEQSKAFVREKREIDGYEYAGLSCIEAMRVKLFPDTKRPGENDPERHNFATLLLEPGDFIYRK